MNETSLSTSDHQKVEKMYEAIYGDGNGNMGMHKMVTEMYVFYSGSKIGGKLVRNTMAFIASLCIAIYVIYQVLTGRNPF